MRCSLLYEGFTKNSIMPSSKKANPLKAQKYIIINTYNLLYKMYGPQHWWPALSAIEVAVGAILTQNTNWSNVEKAISNLRKRKLLSAASLRRARLSSIAKAIQPCGYYNIKAERLKVFVDFLYRVYGGDMKNMNKQALPALRAELLSVKGIGPETADSIMLYAASKPIFVVDAYTKRIAECLGLVSDGCGYDDLQSIFMQSLPQDCRVFNEYHALLVQHAKDVCRKKPLCGICILHKIKKG
jgi:endonuclease III related protein